MCVHKFSLTPRRGSFVVFGRGLGPSPTDPVTWISMVVEIVVICSHGLRLQIVFQMTVEVDKDVSHA